ncbi:MAG: hypothetical protein HY717_09415 [Planctomycetes bacterium]|nr:hypothetical protein [Planctomycetota bacterium]
MLRHHLWLWGSRGLPKGRLGPHSLPGARPFKILLAMLLPLLLWRSAAAQNNGDLLNTYTLLAGNDLIDLCQDSSDGSFWAASQSNGKIYHLSMDFTLLGEISNPHGKGTLLKPVLTRGLTFRAPTQTLLAMALKEGKFEVREVTRSGIELTTEFPKTITPPTGQSDLYGLAWDRLNNQFFWYVDDTNDLVVRSNLSGNVAFSQPFPGDTPPETRLYGRGIDFSVEGGLGYLYITYGNIFTLGPSQIRRLALNGLATGADTPIAASLGPTIRGLVSAQLAGNDVVVLIGEGSNLHVIQRKIPNPIPPSDLQCTIDPNNHVALAWKNNGTSSEGLYAGGIALARNDTLLATLPGGSTKYLDPEPPEGTVVYSLRGSNFGPFSPEAVCSVKTGSGGLMKWQPFPGAKIFDLCRNPSSGDVYATDQGSDGKVYRFDRSLNFIEAISLPNWAHPSGIAFIPEGNNGQGSLMVTRTDGVLMKEFDLAGNPLEAGIPMNPPSGTPVLSGLTYNPDDQELVYIDEPTHNLITIDRNGNLLRVDKPNVITGPPAHGIAYDLLTRNFYATFQLEGTVFVREIYSSGAPTGFNFDLTPLGASISLPVGVNGIEVADNTLLVCGLSTNTLFQVLIVPQGQPFVRSDATGNGEADISDAVRIAEYLFVKGLAPSCMDAADSNDDGVIDISDPVYLLFYLFLGGSPPPAPFPKAGTDPTYLDNLSC